MPVAIVVCLLLIALTTLIHYEMLRLLSQALPRLRMRNRQKLMVAVFGAYAAHALEISVYGVAMFVLMQLGEFGRLYGSQEINLSDCLYFSASTYTSLGFGDIAPVGPIRVLAGAEALNGLLLIAWSASFLYFSMERFWGAPDRRGHTG